MSRLKGRITTFLPYATIAAHLKMPIFRARYSIENKRVADPDPEDPETFRLSGTVLKIDHQVVLGGTKKIIKDRLEPISRAIRIDYFKNRTT